MRRILKFAFLSILFSATLMAAQNSQTFYLATAARAGNIQLPRGIYEVTWSAPSKSRVTLTIKTEDIEFPLTALNFINHPLPHFGVGSDVDLQLTGGANGTNTNTTTTGKSQIEVGHRVLEPAIKYAFFGQRRHR
jgi:hypothetical protein